VPKPNTWREAIHVLDATLTDVPLRGWRVAVQEYGVPNPDVVAALEARGALVTPVPIYKWALPEDVRPLRAAVRAIARDEIDVVLLTAGVQLQNLLAVACEMHMDDVVRRGMERLVVASIGPMTSEEVRRQRLPIDMEPSHPKMGFLVKEVAEQCGEILRAKRSGHAPAHVT
jgi:uroporphyrinogen-III synthase